MFDSLSLSLGFPGGSSLSHRQKWAPSWSNFILEAFASHYSLVLPGFRGQKLGAKTLWKRKRRHVVSHKWWCCRFSADIMIWWAFSPHHGNQQQQLNPRLNPWTGPLLISQSYIFFQERKNLSSKKDHRLHGCLTDSLKPARAPVKPRQLKLFLFPPCILLPAEIIRVRGPFFQPPGFLRLLFPPDTVPGGAGG